MPSVQLDKKRFFKAVGKKLPDKLLAEKLAMLGTDVQSITESDIAVEVFPNRPDLLGLRGFARAMKSFLGVKKGLQNYTVKKGKEIVLVDSELKTIRPYTACAIVRKLKLDEDKLKEIIDMQEKMHLTYGRKRKRVAMGLYPLKAITFPVRFEARTPSDIVFTPLDADKPLPAMQILKDHPKGKDYAHLLFNLRQFPVFVDSDERILSLVPIINSEITGKVTKETKEVFVEVSGHDFEVCHKALIMLCAALADMGGEIESVEVRYGAKKLRTPDFKTKNMKLNAKAVNDYLGTNLAQKDVANSLKKMGYDVRGTMVKVPAWRADILHEVDLIEDVAIGYGYDNLKSTVPNISTVGKESKNAANERILRNLFVSFGYTEIKTFCLSSADNQTRKVKNMRRPLEVENPLTVEYNVLRQQLLPNLLEALGKNRQNEYPQMLFEIGTVWTPEEELRLSFVVCGEKAGFTQTKAAVEAVFKLLGKQLQLRPYEEKVFISGRAAVFPGGFFGEVHPEVLEEFEVPFAVSAGEIRVKELFE